MLFIHTITPNNMEELQSRIEELELQIQERDQTIVEKESEIDTLKEAIKDIYNISRFNQ